MARIDIGKNIINPRTEVASAEVFYGLTDDAKTVRICNELAQALDAYRNGEMPEEEYKKLKQRRKKGCYFYTPHAHFQKGYKSSKGEPIDSGKAIVDLDGCTDFEQLYEQHLKGHEKELGINMVNYSVSHTGGHVLFDIPVGMNRQQAQAWMAHVMGDVVYDKAVHEMERAIYIPCKAYILYIDEERMFSDECMANKVESLERRVESQLKVDSAASGGDKLSLKGDGGALSFRGIKYSDIIQKWWKLNGGEPQEGERNVRLYQLAVNLRAICDNKKEILLQTIPSLGLDEGEFRSIIDSACKEPPKGISKQMKEVLQSLGEKNSSPSGEVGRGVSIDSQLDHWGEQVEALFPQYPILRDVCKGLKRNQYPAALFVAGGFMMTLMTRCTYRFYHRPEEIRRLNNSTLIIGDPASGKSFATRLYKLLAAPIMEADQEGKDAINAYREMMRTKGANKDKPQKPKVIIRVHPARTSNAQFIQDMVNAVEDVDGEKMHLHMLTFDTELDNTVTVQKGGAWIDKLALELKAFHNEEDGQSYSNLDSVLQDFNVYWNYIYTGTPIALRKKVNDQNFGSGLATRLTCIPLPATRFRMLSRESTVDYESDKRLKEWAYKLDRMKGELTLQKIVDELYDWTARRMADAEENESDAEEMLLKRCAYHGLNFSAPFIVMRHWDKMHQDGQYWCGEFETDDVDWQLAELITNIQYACQRHYFGKMAETYFQNKDRAASVNVQRHQKTYEAFSRLPEEFTVEDVMRCFQISVDNTARVRIKRLMRDHLIEKVKDVKEDGVIKSIYRKTGVIMM